MYQFIPVHQLPSGKKLYINAPYISHMYSEQEKNFIHIEGFATLQTRENKQEIKTWLAQNPVQKNKEVTIHKPSIDPNFRKTQKVKLKQIVYLRPLKCGHLLLTFSDKKDLYTTENEQTFLALTQ